MRDIADDIIKALNNNGVSVRIENIWRNTGTTPEVIERVITFDFSEYDKVFEDKIAELDRMRKSWMDKAIEWQQENERLNQRIAELKSKETEKPRCSHAVIVAKEIDGQTYVKFEDFMSVVNDLQAEIGT